MGLFVGARPQARSIIKVTYRCNNRCVFCHSAHLKSIPDPDTDTLLNRVDRALSLGARCIVFSGGEPTTRRDLMLLAQGCRQRNVPFGLITNGRLLSYRPVLSRLVSLGLSYVYMSLHGPESIHDAMTSVPGSFAQTVAALKNLSAFPGIEVTANVVVTRLNLHALRDLVDIVRPWNNVRLKFSAVEPKGSVLDDPSVIPHPLDSAKAVADALEVARRKGFPPDRLGIDGFPHCLVPNAFELQDDLYTHGFFALREVDEAEFFPIDYSNMGKTPRCRGCAMGDPCKGTYIKVFERYSDSFLEPRPGGASNSFNYFPVRDAIDPVSLDCRRIQVRHNGSVLDYATDTGDFDEGTLCWVRNEIQQLYFQLDEAPLVTDFPKQLRKLAKSRDGEVFEVLEDDLFALAEQKIRTILADLSGDVLDVGCGETRYADLLEQGLASGDLRYTGVDPSPGTEVQSLAARYGARILSSSLEDLTLERESFDWILVLRSYNHLEDLWEAFVRLIAALKPGGKVLVVDNVPFALLRSQVRPEHLESANQLRPEHLRNHGLEEAWSFLSAFPLQVLDSQGVTRLTANQWFLLATKRWPSGEPCRDTFRPGP